MAPRVQENTAVTGRVGLDPKFVHPKTSHQMFGHMYEVINEIYLQFFLHVWAVNRKTNLMSLLDP